MSKLVVAVCAFTAFAQSPDESEYRQALGEARQMLAEAEFNAVVQKLTPLLQRFGNRAELRHGLGVAQYQSKNYEAAIEHLSAALPLETDGTPAWRQSVRFLGMAYYISFRWKEAVPLLEDAVSADAGDSDLAYALATCYLQTHDREKATRAYAMLFKLDPDSPQAFALTAQVMYQATFGQDAEALLLEAIKRWPNGSDFRYQLGAIAMLKGDYPGVVRHLEKELAKNPSNALAWHYLGEAFLRLSKLDQAVEALQRAIWLNERSAKSYVLLAEAHLLQENVTVAEDALDMAIQIDPQSYEANFLLARLYQKTKRPDLAKKQMEIANKLRPK